MQKVQDRKTVIGEKLTEQNRMLCKVHKVRGNIKEGERLSSFIHSMEKEESEEPENIRRVTR